MSEIDRIRLQRVRAHCRMEIESMRAVQELADRDGRNDGGARDLVRLALERVIRIADGETA